MENKKQFLLIWRTEEKRLIFYKMIIDKNNGSKQVFFYTWMQNRYGCFWQRLNKIIFYYKRTNKKLNLEAYNLFNRPDKKFKNP